MPNENKEKTYPFRMGWQLNKTVKNDSDVNVLELIHEGLEYYQKKYEKKPNRVSVSQSAYSKGLSIEGIEISPDKQIYTTKIIYIWREEENKNA